MKIVFFGTSQFAIPILDTLLENNLAPFLIVTTPDKTQGRGQKSQSPPVKIWANVHKIKTEQPEKLSLEYLVSSVKDAELFIVASYGKIIPKPLLGIPKYGSLNVHPSILPKYRGPSPIQAAILAGDKETGVTIMLMDEEVDHGRIAANSKFPLSVGFVESGEIRNSKLTYPELENELAKLGAKLLIETIPKWINNEIKPLEQNHAEAVYTKKIAKEDGHINWRTPAEIIERKMRAYYPDPGAYTFWDKNGVQIRLKIAEAEIVPKPSEISDGEVFETKRGFAAGTPNGALEIIKIHPEGKKEMPASTFLNGHRDIIGSTLS